MSGPPRLRSQNIADTESRPVLGPAGNKATPTDNRKPASKPLKKAEKPSQETEKKAGVHHHSPPQRFTVPMILRRQKQQQQEHHQYQTMLLNSSMNASCSSDASSSTTDSSHSWRASRRSVPPLRKKHFGSKAEKVERVGSGTGSVLVKKSVGNEVVAEDSTEVVDTKRRCAWITPNTDQCYVAFHDEEWGVPVHDDKELFELLSLSGALAELPWPAILSKRHIFREIYLDFDPSAVSKLNEKKIAAPGSVAIPLLSELKLRSIIENARQVCKVVEEFGSFDKYIWNFVNHKPIIGQFRYPRQVPVKTPKAEVISKDLVKRGFRSVGPTVIYTFMQVAGLTNDHLISCFRFQECLATGGEESSEKDSLFKTKIEELLHEDSVDLD
ncbi:uncharacterized protein LOC107407231 [Ziziphus jujuba]|uniref:Uncharacterized protein LOC107407231 n=2 Tax=Ziziphus jujuba TaxID=326968 RepID=A0A9B4ATF3_ZIZJJ|nr:uncharacterized protein LOC107407231 [Ziziphus jujuba]KAH7547480.1 hypothetical protein FEM48_Zijuj01G0314500 [Ziziphus jujuba var. spinosa]